jgi:hypothetical protein
LAHGAMGRKEGLISSRPRKKGLKATLPNPA